MNQRINSVRKHALRVAIVIAVFLQLALVNAQDGLIYSGETTWDARSGTLVFVSSGVMPDSKECLFWNIPTTVKRITINSNVTVRGGFRVGYRHDTNPHYINGADRNTSVMHGTDEERWTARHGVAESDKWKYGSINVLADAVVYVSNLTAKNPRGYNISGYANKSIIHVDCCNLIDARNGDNNNSDGFIGSAGSSIRNSFISTSDDGIKVYHEITIENVTIEQKRNGAPIQFGWGDETGNATAHIKNLTIKGVDAENLYNMAPFTWE